MIGETAAILEEMLISVLMTQTMNKTILFSCAILLLGACHDKPEPAQEVDRLPIRIATGMDTRVTDTAFDAGDAVGLYVAVGEALSTSGTHVSNVSFTFDGSAWQSQQELFWKDSETPADFYCYYPYRSSVSDVHAVPVAVSSDQSTAESYAEGDFLWGKRTEVKPTAEPVRIQVSHLMSNLLIFLEPGNGYDAVSLSADLQDVRVTGTLLQATVDLADGTVVPTGTAADIRPLQEDSHYRALVVPQTVSGTPLVTFQVAGYTYTFSPDITLLSGKRHKCTLRVNKTSEGIDIGIVGWETDENDYGGSVN